MLRLENIDVALSKGTKLETKVLQQLELSLAMGEFVVVIGGNGAGKTTMLNVISGFLKPDFGKVILAGKDITFTSQISRSSALAVVMQDPKIGTMEGMTIFENMAFAFKRGNPRWLLPFKSKGRKQLFREKLAELNMGLENRLDEVVANLSGGQRQALSIIMATIADAKILLLDEITAALDPKTADIVMNLANKIVREERRTCIMITHNMVHAIKYGDRTLLLREGKFVKEFSGAKKRQLTPALLATEFGEL